MRQPNYETKDLNEFKRVKFNVAMHGRKKGQVEKVEFENGKPKDSLLRRRFNDADECIEILIEPETKIAKAKAKGSN